jgi:septal ring factor EnvC (AmiA/AmiB activator)
MKLLLVVLLLGVVVFAATAGGAGSNAMDVEELRKMLSNIEGEVAQLKQDLQSLRGELDRLGRLLDENWTEVQGIKDRVARLESANRTLRSRIDELQRLIESLDSQVSGLNSSLMVVRGQLGRNWTEVQRLRGDVGKNATLLKGVQSGLELLWWLVVGLGAVAAAAVVLAVLAWRRAGRGSAGGVEVCG